MFGDCKFDTFANPAGIVSHPLGSRPPPFRAVDAIFVKNGRGLSKPPDLACVCQPHWCECSFGACTEGFGSELLSFNSHCARETVFCAATGQMRENAGEYLAQGCGIQCLSGKRGLQVRWGWAELR